MTSVRAFLDFSDPYHPAGPRLQARLAQPRAVLQADTLDAVHGVINAVQHAAVGGAWCVGYVRYEAAAAFDTAYTTHAADGPLAWFAVFDAPSTDALAPEPLGAASVEWTDALSRSDFDAVHQHIQQAIANGECYQVNATAPVQGRLHGSASALFAALQGVQPGGYAAHLECGDGVQVLSVSPELFFDWRAQVNGEGRLLTRPMKGTAARLTDPQADAAQVTMLQTSPKERAENVMIVDLLRNDLSRIAQPYSVQVPKLFQVEGLPTVWQMTSDVIARSRVGTQLLDVFTALFPCGSVTGAPKVAAMQKIKRLEPAPRGVYCGAVGVVRPGDDGGIVATFNVPIRTAELAGQQLRCGIGSGLVAGAQADAEWAEWAAKRAFIEQAAAPFALLETLALEEGVLRNGAQHLARLQQSAAHWRYDWNAAQVQERVAALVQAHPTGVWRVRLVLDSSGDLQAEAYPLAASPRKVLLALATRPMAAAHSDWVRYKTTRRAHYAAFAPAAGGPVWDTVLYNSAQEITESTFGNIAMELDGEWVTPPLHCGLLPGVGRALALQQCRVRERVVCLHDLPRITGWAFINSLRGWIDAELETPSPAVLQSLGQR